MQPKKHWSVLQYSCTARAADEVDWLRNAGNGYQTLMDPQFSPGAVRWGWTGTITHQGWTDVRRPLAFVTHDKAWEEATEQAVRDEVRHLCKGGTLVKQGCELGVWLPGAFSGTCAFSEKESFVTAASRPCTCCHTYPC